jgi:hypothetical protein
MKNDPSPPKPNQLKPKYVILSTDRNGITFAFGTPSGRAFHGWDAAQNATRILSVMHPDTHFNTIKIHPYLVSEHEIVYNDTMPREQ